MDALSHAESLAMQYNARLATTGRDDVEWIATGGELRLTLRRDGAPRVERCTPANVDRLNRALRKFGVSFRFAADGLPFNLRHGEEDPTATGDQR